VALWERIRLEGERTGAWRRGGRIRHVPHRVPDPHRHAENKRKELGEISRRCKELGEISRRCLDVIRQGARGDLEEMPRCDSSRLRPSLKCADVVPPLRERPKTV
jgi:hypothetical protein